MRERERSLENVMQHILHTHNIIHIHNNVLRDRQYFMGYSIIPTEWGTFRRWLSVPRNIVMDLNNVMEATYILTHINVSFKFWEETILSKH